MHALLSSYVRTFTTVAAYPINEKARGRARRHYLSQGNVPGASAGNA